MDLPGMLRLGGGTRTVRGLGSVAVALLLGVALACGGGTLQETAPPVATDSEESAAPAQLEYGKWETTTPGEVYAYNQRTNLVQRGHLVYGKYCVGCHGEYGNGNGPAAERLITKPRDFTSGIYKFRSTDSSSLPLESDLYRTISRGLSRVSMPSFRLVPESDKIAVIEYIKTFYPRWEDEKGQRTVVPVPLPPRDLMTEQRIARGQVVYVEMQCWKCHGIDGRGTGATQTEYVDAWDNEQRPFDFTRGSLKGGNGPDDIYRTFHTGLRSIMPSYGGETLAAVTADAFDSMRGPMSDEEAERLRPYVETFPETADAIYGEMTPHERAALAERNSWDLVAFILSLRTEISTAEAVLGTAGG